MPIKYKKEQPKDGDCVVHCGHTDKIGLHFWNLKGKGFEIKSPEGLLVKPDWIVACDKCAAPHMETPMSIPIRGMAVWVGDDPVFEESN